VNSYYVSAGPPAWTYIFAVPAVIGVVCWWVSTIRPGVKVRRYKIVDGYRVRDYDAERKLREDTRSGR
jgi:hypothetical protein